MGILVLWACRSDKPSPILGLNKTPHEETAWDIFLSYLSVCSKQKAFIFMFFCSTPKNSWQKKQQKGLSGTIFEFHFFDVGILSSTILTQHQQKIPTINYYPKKDTKQNLQKSKDRPGPKLNISQSLLNSLGLGDVWKSIEICHKPEISIDVGKDKTKFEERRSNAMLQPS